MKVITSTANPTIKATVRLHRAEVRKRERRTIIEGPHAVDLATRAGAQFDLVLAREGEEASIDPAVEIYLVSDRVLRAVAATENPRGPVAVVRIPEAAALQARDTLVLAGVADPGNAGTLLRTASALGMQTAVFPGAVDLWSPKVLRAAAGAHWQMPPVSAAGIDTLIAAGLDTVALVVAGGDPPGLVLANSGPVAIIVGGEAHGLPAGLAAAAARRLTIPMPGGAESLNAAVAGAIALYERTRYRPAQPPVLADG